LDDGVEQAVGVELCAVSGSEPRECGGEMGEAGHGVARTKWKARVKHGVKRGDARWNPMTRRFDKGGSEIVRP
jgi:hypothetical protein